MSDTLLHILQGAFGGIVGTIIALTVANKYEEHRLRKMARILQDERAENSYRG